MNVGVWGQVKSEISSLPVAVRVSKTRVLKLPILNSKQASAIAPALSACSPREHDISTREPLLHIRKLNLIGSE